MKGHEVKIYVSALILVSTIGLPQGAHAQRVEVPVPPPVPEAIEVSSEYTPYLAAHAIGTQGYTCVVAGAVFKWTFFGPQAALFDGENQQVMAHFLSPTPYSLLPNPTWQHSRDSSTVWGQVMSSSSDAGYVALGAIPWLLLEAAVVGDGPTYGDKLTATRRIQRLNTVGGIAPTTGCAGPADIGKRALVPYEADYFFYKEKKSNEPDWD